MLTKQNEVLSNLASLDEEEAARAQTASSRWQVSPVYNIILVCICSVLRCVWHTRPLVILQCPPTMQKDHGLMHPHSSSHNCDHGAFACRLYQDMTLTESEGALQEAQEQASDLLVQQQQYQQVQQQLLGDLR